MMKLFILLIIFSLSLSGYCAAGYAFSDISIQIKVKHGPMTDMPDCPFMKKHRSNDNKSHSTTKTTGMNCKACCMSLVEFPAFSNVHYVGLEELELSSNYIPLKSDIQFPILHPPNL